MNKSIIGGLIAICLFTFNVSQSHSQVPTKMGCQSMEKGMEFFKSKAKEGMLFRGLSQKGHITLIFLNKLTGSWSASVILPTNDPNNMCLVDAGTTGELVLDDKMVW